MRLMIVLTILLAAFLTLGFLTERSLSRTSRDLSRLIAVIERETTQQQGAAAAASLRRLERRWARTEMFWALVTDHREMDQIQLAIDRADKYLRSGGLSHALAELASLRFLLEHIPKKETLGWSSVF